MERKKLRQIVDWIAPIAIAFRVENDSKENISENISEEDKDFDAKQDMKNIHIKYNTTNNIHISINDFYENNSVM